MAYVAAGTAQTGSLDQFTPTVPAGTAADDIVYLIICQGGTSTWTLPGWTVPSWGILDANSWRSTLAWRRYTSGTFALCTGGGGVATYAQTFSWSGCVKTGDPYESGGNASGGASASVTYPNVVNSGTDRLALAIQANDPNIRNGVVSNAGGTSLTWSERADAGSGTDYGVSVDDAPFAAAGTASSIVSTLASAPGSWKSYSMALLPYVVPPPSVTGPFPTFRPDIP